MDTSNSRSRVPIPPDGYEEFLRGLKQRIQHARIKAALAVNRELILFYWQLGRDILERQLGAGWGAKIIDRLAEDLHREFPEMKGFSARNLKYMRAFAEAWQDESIVQQAAAQLPWFHNCVLLDKVKGTEERLWYIQQATQHGWSRNVLVLQIESRLYHRQGKALTNFQQTLPAPQSDLAGQLLKDPYNFDFLTLSSEAHERDLERGLLEHLRQFLLELGVGFAFVGSQYPLEVGGEDFKLGIILCKTRNKVLVEYALRGSNRPIGVPEFRLAEALPDHLKGTLPTVEELEAELAKGTTIDGQTSSE